MGGEEGTAEGRAGMGTPCLQSEPGSRWSWHCILFSQWRPSATLRHIIPTSYEFVSPSHSFHSYLLPNPSPDKRGATQ